jgi:hypothetical protein
VLVILPTYPNDNALLFFVALHNIASIYFIYSSLELLGRPQYLGIFIGKTPYIIVKNKTTPLSKVGQK